jgi:hypothetical protein
MLTEIKRSEQREREAGRETEGERYPGRAGL